MKKHKKISKRSTRRKRNPCLPCMMMINPGESKEILLGEAREQARQIYNVLSRQDFSTLLEASVIEQIARNISTAHKLLRTDIYFPKNIWQPSKKR